PGILLRLTAEGISAEALADGLTHRSGLLAIAGTSSARDIEERDGTGDKAATLALAMFARRAAAGIAAATVALSSLDALVFTGGIGEHSVGLRRSIVRRLAALGVPQQLDEAAADAVLTAGPPWVLVVSAREDRVIADEVNQLLEGA
ncbi:MAG: acetate/propionate family kinase, partial [Candidatus Limnocylindria bacterium]